MATAFSRLIQLSHRTNAAVIIFLSLFQSQQSPGYAFD